MTVDHPVRRFLARICSADTMARVVDPTLADMRWESGRAVWLGYLALLKALTVHAVLSIPAALGRASADDDHALGKVAGYSIGGAVIGALLLNSADLVKGLLRHGAAPVNSATMLLLLLPQALVLTLPAALLVAVPLAFKRQEPTARSVPRVLALSAGCVLVTFATLEWIVPEANQAWRTLVADRYVVRGLNERGFAERSRELERLRTFHGAERAVRRLEYQNQVRIALVAAPLPLGLLALGLARTRLCRRRPILLGIAALAFYFLMLFLPRAIGETFIFSGQFEPGPSLLAWVPSMLIALVAALLFTRNPSGRLLVDSRVR